MTGPPPEPKLLGPFLMFFEVRRLASRSDGKSSATALRENQEYRVNEIKLHDLFIKGIINIYNDRSTARVADVSSIMSRDWAIWILYLVFLTDHDVAFSKDGKAKIILESLGVSRTESFDDAEVYMDTLVNQDFDSAARPTERQQ
jgi:hypothetical protein